MQSLRRPVLAMTVAGALALSICGIGTTVSAAPVAIRENGTASAKLVPPQLSGTMSGIVQATLDCYLERFYGWKLPETTSAEAPGLYVVVGNPDNNVTLKQLAAGGLDLGLSDLGDEGFRILTHEAGNRRFVIVAANGPRGLKHGCQELVFFRIAAMESGARIDWPLDVLMTPQFGYRSIYMLPCWSAHDSIESWRRILKFNSEITLNRSWFWLAGFPLMAEYGGEYAGTDLAKVENVRGLVELCRSEGVKFYIGGGWFTFHHEKAVGTDVERGAQYYLDLFKLLPDAEGIYLEPPGEGYEVSETIWKRRTAAMARMMKTIWRCRPEFEFALAIGSFNNPGYREMVHGIDDQRTFWWWCWGDPLRDNALSMHPLIVRWHTVVQMSNFHGSTQPPRPEETALTGFASSYDPGMGYGNPWNGWAKMGVDHPRNFDPYTMPYFSHQYLFRERCWNVNLTQEQFAQRLGKRLFDADMPAEAITHYLKLAGYCPNPAGANEQELDAIASFVDANARRGTARNRDTIGRMREAIEGIRNARASAAAKQ